jgi:uncharacterized membrane protein
MDDLRTGGNGGIGRQLGMFNPNLLMTILISLVIIILLVLLFQSSSNGNGSSSPNNDTANRFINPTNNIMRNNPLLGTTQRTML